MTKQENKVEVLLIEENDGELREVKKMVTPAERARIVEEERMHKEQRLRVDSLHVKGRLIPGDTKYSLEIRDKNLVDTREIVKAIRSILY